MYFANRQRIGQVVNSIIDIKKLYYYIVSENTNQLIEKLIKHTSQ